MNPDESGQVIEEGDRFYFFDGMGAHRRSRASKDKWTGWTEWAVSAWTTGCPSYRASKLGKELAAIN